MKEGEGRDPERGTGGNDGLIRITFRERGKLTAISISQSMPEVTRK